MPESAKEYAELRREYRKQLTEVRKRYKEEWDGIVAARRAAAVSAEEELQARRAAKRALRRLRKARVALQHAATRRAENKLAEYNRAHRLAHRQRFEARLQALRREWLAQLVAESQSWIPEDKIDERITPDLFAMRYPPHLEEWYEKRELRAMQKQEALEGGGSAIARYSEQVDEEFESDWESDVEEIDPDLPSKYRSSLGLQVEELLHGKPMDEIAKDFADWEEKYKRMYGVEFTDSSDDEEAARDSIGALLNKELWTSADSAAATPAADADDDLADLDFADVDFDDLDDIDDSEFRELEEALKDVDAESDDEK